VEKKIVETAPAGRGEEREVRGGATAFGAILYPARGRGDQEKLSQNTKAQSKAVSDKKPRSTAKEGKRQKEGGKGLSERSFTFRSTASTKGGRTASKE